MTTPATGPRGAETEEQTEHRMRTVAAGLNAAGLDTSVHDTSGVLDVRATLHREGCGPVQITYDADQYVQLTYWHAPGATPAQVVTTMNAVLAVITRSP